MNKIPDLLEIQKRSFLFFLTKEIKEEIKKIDSFCKSNNEFEIKLYSEKIKIKMPVLSDNETQKKLKTYKGEIYIPIQIIYKRKIKSKIHNIFFGEIPMMTKHGTFIINGFPRVIINQIVKSPGIYFNTNFDNNKKRITNALIISDKGLWLNIKKRENFIWAKFGKDKKVPIFTLLQSIGLTQKKIFHSIQNREFLKKSLTFINPTSNLNCLHHLKIITQAESIVNLEARNIFFQNFMLKDSYSLGKAGRNKINKKLKILNTTEIDTLRPEDILATIDYLINLDYGIGCFDEIDNLENKQLRSAGELIKEKLKIGIITITKKAKEKIEKTFINFLIKPSKNLTKWKNKKSKKQLEFIFNSKTLFNSLTAFLWYDQLSQFMDETNPLAEITHKRKICSFGGGGLNRKRISLDLREIHPSQYGRICPIETPEGQNTGLISSLTIGARINKWGLIQSPFIRIKNRKLKKNLGKFFLSAKQEENTKITHNQKIISNKKLNKKSIYNKINYIGISPLQMISIATSLIPFLEHDDANRALMGSNMQRQAVPIINPDNPIVGTGLELETARDNSSIILAKQSGLVIKSNSKEIFLKTFINLNKIKITENRNYWKKFNQTLKYQLIEETSNITSLYNTQNIFKKLKKDFLKKKLKNEIKRFKKHKSLKKIKNEIVKYTLTKYKKSNQNTCINNKQLVYTGEWVQNGDIMADNSTTTKGELSLGKNLLVAYMPWEGYNFEDAIIINERLIHKNFYTSIHIDKYEIKTRQTEFGSEIFTNNLPNIKTPNLDHNGIIKTGKWVKNGDILIGKITPRKNTLNQSPESRLLRSIFGKETRNVKNTSLRVPPGISGRIINTQIFKKQTARVYLAHKKEIKTGDKFSGRHGNKGIISKILPQEDMPYLQNGIPIDIILNPLGVPSRMNVGQLFECLLGLAGYFLKENYRITPFNETYGEEISKKITFQKLYEASKHTNQNWILEKNNPGKSRIFDGRTGKTFDQSIVVGYSYILKLFHLVDKKIQMRSIGPYSKITQQPLKGKAKKGGQRLGEMEVWSLQGFGAAYNLQELLTIKSDDIQARNKAQILIIERKKISKPKVPECFKVLIRELQCLCLDVNLHNTTK
uniref:DNA-directed RNA polymerase subunit beta n=1 Tax=Eutreptia viridis TaxID=96908 RepID=H8ZXH7_9EUGL|nr:RNA polymerase beta subunit [Eutreptia viridis]